MADNKKEIPYVPCTQKQADDIWNHGGRYVQVKLPKSKWRWYKVDVKKYGTWDEALEVLKNDKMFDALEDDEDYMADVPGAMGKVKARYDWAFHEDRIRKSPELPKPAWKGILAGEA